MKATLFLSSIFFLLGLKVSSLIDLRGKANAVDKIITNKIINSKPVNAIPLFKDSEEKEEIKEDKTQKELPKQEHERPVTPEN
jgi:hypothetical protein